MTRKKSTIKEGAGYRVFSLFNYCIVLFWSLLCITPFIHMLAVSLSAVGPANANQVSLWPLGLNIDAYAEAFSDVQILSSLKQSFMRVLAGVSVQMLFTILAAYPLSREKSALPGKTFYVVFIIITMLFSGGLIPYYVLVVNYLDLTNTVWALVLPGAVPVFNLIILLNFFRQIPKEIEESAVIDGAGHVILLTRIYLPLSKNALLTLILFACVGHWNAWFDGMIFMRDPIYYPLSTYLRTLSARLNNVTTMEDARLMMRMSKRTLLMAYTVICTVPIVCVYPFLQRYVKTGLVLGSVKG
jgi:putative aldouronate transport system permease protein